MGQFIVLAILYVRRLGLVLWLVLVLVRPKRCILEGNGGCFCLNHGDLLLFSWDTAKRVHLLDEFLIRGQTPAFHLPQSFLTCSQGTHLLSEHFSSDDGLIRLASSFEVLQCLRMEQFFIPQSRDSCCQLFPILRGEFQSHLILPVLIRYGRGKESIIPEIYVCPL